MSNFQKNCGNCNLNQPYKLSDLCEGNNSYSTITQTTYSQLCNNIRQFTIYTEYKQQTQLPTIHSRKSIVTYIYIYIYIIFNTIMLTILGNILLFGFLHFSYCGIVSSFHVVGFCPVGFCLVRSCP